MVTATVPLSPAAVGSAWSEFFRPFAATSPMITHPLPEPEPLEIAGQVAPDAFPSGKPVSTSRRYIAFPAFGASRSRFGIRVSMSGKYPDPTITALIVRVASREPTAGSDQV